MGYAELIQTLEQLPEDKRCEILDCAKFIAARHTQQQLEKEIEAGLHASDDLDADVVFDALASKYQAMTLSA